VYSYVFSVSTPGEPAESFELESGSALEPTLELLCDLCEMVGRPPPPFSRAELLVVSHPTRLKIDRPGAFPSVRSQPITSRRSIEL